MNCNTKTVLANTATSEDLALALKTTPNGVIKRVWPDGSIEIGPDRDDTNQDDIGPEPCVPHTRRAPEQAGLFPCDI